MEMGDSSMFFEHPTFHDPIQVHYNPNPRKFLKNI